MQDEWHVMPEFASALWTEATFHFQMQIQERVGCSNASNTRIKDGRVFNAHEK